VPRPITSEGTRAKTLLKYHARRFTPRFPGHMNQREGGTEWIPTAPIREDGPFAREARVDCPDRRRQIPNSACRPNTRRRGIHEGKGKPLKGHVKGISSQHLSAGIEKRTRFTMAGGEKYGEASFRWTFEPPPKGGGSRCNTQGCYSGGRAEALRLRSANMQTTVFHISQLLGLECRGLLIMG